MNNFINKHKIFWTDKSFIFSVSTGILFFFISLIVNYNAGNYATKKASNGVTDIILDNFPAMNMEWIFVYGAILFALFLVILLLKEPRQIPFVIKSIALFIFIRAIFISLTHIGPIPFQISFDSSAIIRNLMFGADYFFSGHTGLPFLMALSFWKNKFLRILFLATSIIFGVSALLGHYHYSIDVFAAFFITYAVFHISLWLFPRDYKIFIGEL